MNCEEIRPQLPMMLYGELSFDEEETVESHLDGCTECRGALERERELSALFDQVAVEPSPALLRECRENLFSRLQNEAPAVAVPVAAADAKPEKEAGGSWWQRFIESISIPIQHPAGAFALLVVGFLGARFVPQNALPFAQEMTLADFGPGRVHSVEPAADGTVRIVFDEMRQRTVNGRMDDGAIRALLLSAAKDPSDSLRLETVSVLTTRAEGTENAKAEAVRDMLVYTVRNDSNDGVRLRAMKGLEGFLGESDVRGALADVLATDSNPSMRLQAIDLLMQSLDREQAPQGLDPRIVGVLQSLISSESENPLMRQQCQRALEMVQASAQVF